MAPAFERLRDRRSPDDVIGRRELIEAIVAHRQNVDRARKAASGVRLRDVMEQG